MIRELRFDPGLCGACVHRRLLRSRRSVFLRCALADGDPRFPRYPVLPVGNCSGFWRAAGENGKEPPDDRGPRSDTAP